MRTLETFNLDTDKWEETQMKDLIDGDVFRIFDSGIRYVNKATGDSIWIVKGEPYINEDEIWSVKTYF